MAMASTPPTRLDCQAVQTALANVLAADEEQLSAGAQSAPSRAP
jgi:hypothetical protein